RSRGRPPTCSRSRSAHAPVALTTARAWTRATEPPLPVGTGHIPHHYAGHPPVPIPEELLHPAVVEGGAAVAGRLPDQPEHQAGVVRLSVLEDVAPLELVLAHVGRGQDERLPAQVAVGVEAAQAVVEFQAETVDEPAGVAPPVDGQEEGQGLHQPRRVPQEPLPLPDRRPGEAHLGLGQVPQAPVDQLPRPAGGAPGEVPLLQEQGPEAQADRLPEHPRPHDPPADDHQIPGRPIQLRPHLGTRGGRHLGTSSLHRSTRLPGFMIPWGSRAAAAWRSTSRPRVPFSASRYGLWSNPTPCWWLMVPPCSTMARLAAPFRARQRSRSRSGSPDRRKT